MAVWVIRGGSGRGLHEEEFIDSGSTGLDFGVEGTARRPDQVLRDEIREHCLRFNEERGLTMESKDLETVVTRFLNQVVLFRDTVQPGDTVIMPRKGSGGHMVRLGVIESGYEFWPVRFYAHRRRVQWEAEDKQRDTVPYSWSPSNQLTIFKVG